MQHHFDIDIAKEYGILEAVILDHLCFWTRRNEANDEHIHDGKVWTYNSVRAFSKVFPYASTKQIRTALSNLEESGLIETGNFNKNVYDRTKWYSLTDAGMAVTGYKSDFSHGAKAICPVGQTATFAQKGKPIPDTNTDTNTPYSPPQGAGELFDLFWGEYPKNRRTGKAKCANWFKTHRPNEQTVQDMIRAIRYLKTTEQWMTDGGRFIPLPATFLNQRRWEDDTAKPQEEKKVRWLT